MRIRFSLVVIVAGAMGIFAPQAFSTAATPVHGRTANGIAAITPTGKLPAGPVPLDVMDLRTSYTEYLVREQARPLAVTYARGHAGPARLSAACSEPACPLVYHGGPVQHTPKVYLLLWGPNWASGGGDTLYLSNFLAGLGVRPGDTWSTTMEQYTDATGRPNFSGSVLKGVFQDTATPPAGATSTQLAAEADAFYADHGLTDATDTQIVIATQSGTCPQGFPCLGGPGTYCAWHSYTSVNSVPFTNLPYLLDGPCGEGILNSPGTYDGFSIVEGHEFAETVIDPLIASGWSDYSDGSGGEIADKCSWTGLADVTLSTGSFAMQPLWSNSANRCLLTSPSDRPDLVVSNVIWSPSAVHPGTPLTFSATVTNEGTSATPAGVKHGVAFLVDGVEQSWSDSDTASLAAGASITLTANGGPSGAASWAATVGTHSIQAWVDDLKLIAESDETNNTSTTSLTVSPLSPDLTVTALSWSPRNPAPGSAVSFKATIRNQGAATPPGVVHGIAFFVDGRQVSWSDTDTASLAEGASITLTADGGQSGGFTWPASRGKHSVKAWVDDQNRISESNEANNIRTATLTVYAPSTAGRAAISSGSPKSGSVASLSGADGISFRVSSTASRTRTVTWSATFADVPNATDGLQVRYRGKASSDSLQTISLFNYTTNTWVALKTVTVGSAPATLLLTPTGAMADYVGGTTGNGSVRVQSRTTNSSAPFYTSTDQLVVGYL